MVWKCITCQVFHAVYDVLCTRLSPSLTHTHTTCSAAKVAGTDEECSHPGAICGEKDGVCQIHQDEGKFTDL